MKFYSVILLLLAFPLSLAAQTKTQTKTVVIPVMQPQSTSFAAVTLDGTKIDTAALLGKVVVLNLWFINCPNCREEIKMLNDVVDQYGGNKDVVFIGLAASKKPDLEKFLAKNPFKYQIVPSAEMIMFSKFATPDRSGEINIPFPMHYVIDRMGNVVVKVQGIKGVDAEKAELAKQFPGKTAVR